MKIFLLLGFILFAPLGIGANAVIDLHLECKSRAGCLKVTGSDGKAEEIEGSPSLILSPETVKEAKVSEGPGSIISITLNDEAAKRLADITGANINSKLVVVYSGKVLLAPVIKQKIEGGKLLIEAPKENSSKFFEEVDWIQSGVEKQTQNLWTRDNIMYGLSWAALIVALLAFAKAGRSNKA